MILAHLALCVSLLAKLPLTSYAANPTQVVDLGYAKYQGVPSAFGNTNFLGVRYAAPPTGEIPLQFTRSLALNNPSR